MVSRRIIIIITKSTITQTEQTLAAIVVQKRHIVLTVDEFAVSCFVTATVLFKHSLDTLTHFNLHW